MKGQRISQLSTCLQVPWRALQSRPVVVEMSDVWLCGSPRKEEDWEEDSASQRAQAAKQVLHLLPDGTANDSACLSRAPTGNGPHHAAFTTQACSHPACMQAELAARDLMRLSRPGSRGGAGTSTTPEGSGFAWSFLSHLSALVLNRLQMTISNVHICFQVSDSWPDKPLLSQPPCTPTNLW